jgi:hypothetical protein
LLVEALAEVTEFVRRLVRLPLLLALTRPRGLPLLVSSRAYAVASALAARADFAVGAVASAAVVPASAAAAASAVAVWRRAFGVTATS